MMKVTKIVTLSVVFVVSMSQVIAQDPSQIEIEEKAYVVSDKGRFCEDKWAPAKCAKLAKKGKCENNRIGKWKCCNTCQQCSSNMESVLKMPELANKYKNSEYYNSSEVDYGKANKYKNLNSSEVSSGAVEDNCPYIGDGTKIGSVFPPWPWYTWPYYWVECKLIAPIYYACLAACTPHGFARNWLCRVSLNGQFLADCNCAWYP